MQMLREAPALGIMGSKAGGGVAGAPVGDGLRARDAIRAELSRFLKKII